MRLATIALASALLAGTAVAAMAADLGGAPPPRYESYAPPLPPAPIWQGFYMGANLGYGWDAGDTRMTTTDGRFATGLDNAGVFGGGQFGYNWQFGHVVAGLEADIQSSDINGGTVTGANLVTSDVNYFGTVRGRLGYAAGPWLLYATGGFAWGDVATTAVGVTGAGNTYALSGSSIATGYVVGGGLEYAINRSWSLKGEYQYINLDADKLTGFDSGGNGVSAHTQPELHTVRMGLNYRF